MSNFEISKEKILPIAKWLNRSMLLLEGIFIICYGIFVAPVVSGAGALGPFPLYINLIWWLLILIWLFYLSIAIVAKDVKRAGKVVLNVILIWIAIFVLYGYYNLT
ncbi:MAG: hypothetical protein JWO40_245 [Candidatus Doudnabacteria bacterium]|nr:hypothetical protein [Candidatus Doudnabacteria bacterium]